MKKFFKEILFTLIIVFIISNIINFLRIKNPNINIKNILHRSPNIIYFWGDWCPICKLESSQIKQISKNLKVIKIAVNSKKQRDSINDNGRLAKLFSVKAYPTIYYVVNNKIVYTDIGFTSIFSIKIKYFIFNILF